MPETGGASGATTIRNPTYLDQIRTGNVADPIIAHEGRDNQAAQGPVRKFLQIYLMGQDFERARDTIMAYPTTTLQDIRSEVYTILGYAADPYPNITIYADITGGGRPCEDIVLNRQDVWENAFNMATREQIKLTVQIIKT